MFGRRRQFIRSAALDLLPGDRFASRNQPAQVLRVHGVVHLRYPGRRLVALRVAQSGLTFILPADAPVLVERAVRR